MKDLVKIINDDYRKYRFSGVSDVDECMRYICRKQSKINDYIQRVEYQQMLNRKDYKLSCFLSYLPLIKVYKTPEFFDEDNFDINLGIDISVDYLRYYDRLFGIVSKENYTEVAKLSSFIGKMYDYNIEHLEENRAKRERYYCGSEESNLCELINKILVDEFLDGVISSIVSDKVSEKVKK